jgi:hypothetical protein
VFTFTFDSLTNFIKFSLLYFIVNLLLEWPHQEEICVQHAKIIKKTPNLSFFRTPKDKRSKQWIMNSGRKDLIEKGEKYLNDNITFCALHFDRTQFTNERKNKLVWNAISTIFEGLMKPTTTTFLISTQITV